MHLYMTTWNVRLRSHLGFEVVNNERLVLSDVSVEFSDFTLGADPKLVRCVCDETFVVPASFKRANGEMSM